MPNQRARKRPVPESFEDRFNRELAEINASLARLAASLPPPPPAVESSATPRKRGRPKRGKGAAVKRSTATPPSAPAPELAAAPVLVPSAPAPAPATEPSAPPPPAPVATPLPTGSDLGDPKNFGLMPPTEDLEPGDASPDEYRKRLARDLAFANKVLHTSGVAAAVWREWRGFEKTINERLRVATDERGS